MSSEKKLFKFICDYYDKKGISYEIDEKEYDILVINKDRELPVNFFVSAQTNPLSIRICGYMPFKVPSKSQEMTIMALQAINQRLSMGHFLMYTSSGTVEYRVNIPLIGIKYDEKWLEKVLNEAFSIITSRDEKIFSLLRGEITFEEFDKSVR